VTDGKPCWIDTEDDNAALATAYETVRRGAEVPNLYRAFASRPDLMTIADAFYWALLHDETRRRLDAWEQELIATLVAELNGCAYAAAHHGANLEVLAGGGERAAAMRAALAAGRIDDPVFDTRAAALLGYAARLTRDPAAMTEDDLAPLRAAGLDDAAIFEANQIVANFAYWTRVINGLGIALGDERIGFHG